MVLDYGPPTPPRPWPTVTVGHPAAKGGEWDVLQPRVLVEQRRQLNARAYLAVDLEEVEATD